VSNKPRSRSIYVRKIETVKMTPEEYFRAVRALALVIADWEKTVERDLDDAA